LAKEAARRLEFERWPKFQAQWIRIFDQVIRLREQEGRVNEYASGQEWFEWWLGDRAQEIPIDTDQMMLEDY
jgi:hypothetical protein